MAAINLRTLQRLDSGIEEILQTVCHVCLYEFSCPDGTWQQARIEGPLHVYRKGRRTHGFVILNRNDTNHLNEILTPDFEFWLQGQFLEYKDHSNRIFCIWFYKESDARQVHDTICQQQTRYQSDSQENGHHHQQHQHANDQHNNNSNNSNGLNGQNHVSIMDLLRRGYEKRSRLNNDSSTSSSLVSCNPHSAHAHQRPDQRSTTVQQEAGTAISSRTRTASLPAPQPQVFPLTRRDCGWTMDSGSPAAAVAAAATTAASSASLTCDPTMLRLLMNGMRRRRRETTGCGGVGGVGGAVVGSDSERSQRQAV